MYKMFLVHFNSLILFTFIDTKDRVRRKLLVSERFVVFDAHFSKLSYDKCYKIKIKKDVI